MPPHLSLTEQHLTENSSRRPGSGAQKRSRCKQEPAPHKTSRQRMGRRETKNDSRNAHGKGVSVPRKKTEATAGAEGSGGVSQVNRGNRSQGRDQRTKRSCGRASKEGSGGWRGRKAGKLAGFRRYPHQSLDSSGHLWREDDIHFNGISKCCGYGVQNRKRRLTVSQVKMRRRLRRPST